MTSIGFVMMIIGIFTINGQLNKMDYIGLVIMLLGIGMMSCGVALKLWQVMP